MKAKLTCVAVGLFLVLLFSGAAEAVTLTVQPITWDIIGLDSNAPAAGPKYFPVGVRITNTSGTTSGELTATFNWDPSEPTYIKMRPGTLGTAFNPLALGTLGPGASVDAYFEVEITQNALAIGTQGSYYIRVNEFGVGNTDSPRPRSLYVESLVSQSRNSVSNMYLSTTQPPLAGPYGTAIANGGNMTLMVGNIYWITLAAGTATNGYEQIQSFVNFPNIIFQTLEVTTTYSADSSTNVSNPSDKLYGDGCVWDNDPTSPNYRSCLSTGKVGGTVITIYKVKILQIPDAPLTNPEPLTTLIYDFSGSSYHYNSDFGVSTRYATIVNASIEKSFSPKSLNPNTIPAGTSTLTFTITNPGAAPITDVNFTDNLPTNGGAGQMSIASPTVTYTGFTVNPSPSSLTVGQTALTFSGATVPGLSSATIAVTVTTSATGTYNNDSGNLIINTNIDTGDDARDTLVATDKPPGPSSCTTPSTMATWTMPTTGQGSGGPPPPYTTKLPDVATAAASSSGGTTVRISTTEGFPTVNSWEILGGWQLIGALPNANATPYYQFQVDTSNYGGAAISFSVKIDPPGAWQSAGSNNIIYVYSSADGINWSNIGNFQGDKGKWVASGTLPAATTGVSYTYFRINAAGAATSAATVFLDNITITGCPRPFLPTLSKFFLPGSICQGNFVMLVFTITNPSGNSTTLTDVSFKDTLPLGLDVTDSTGQLPCNGSGTLRMRDNYPDPDTIELTGGTLIPGESCLFSVTVTGTAAGIYTNTSGSISSAETGPNTTTSGTGTAGLTVVAPPVINKNFGTTNLITGETTSLTFTITNPNSATDLTGVGFTDTLPAGLVVATPNGLSGGCGSGTITAVAGSGAISLSSANLTKGSSCTFSVNVTGTTGGEYTNTVSVSSANGCTGNTADASLIVRELKSSLAFQKKISTSPDGPWYSYLVVPVGTPLYYQFVVENTGETALTSVAVSDPSLNPFSCTWKYVDSTGTVVDFVPQSPLTIPVPVASGDQHVAYCGPMKTVTAQEGVHTNTATASATGVPDASDSAMYEGQYPTAVVIGRVGLGYVQVTDYLQSIGVPEIGLAELQHILRVWMPDSPAWESTDRRALLAALMAYLDPDGDGHVVVFRWETLEERGAIGFYADRLTAGAWVRINAGMLPGLIASPMGAEYWLADPGASPGKDYVYRLIEVEARGTTREYGPFDLRVETPLP